MKVSKATLELIRLARCADLSDALDSMGLQDRYTMNPNMRPLFPGIRFAGYAHTQAYRPSDIRMPYLTKKEFMLLQYAPIEKGGYNALTAPGVGSYAGGPDEVLVIDAQGLTGGILGSENAMAYVNKGCVGMVIDGTLRDSPEAILQQSPVFSTVRSYIHPMGRIRIYSDNEPIVCAGAIVKPGDIVCGDDDGVLSVPAEHADELAERAYVVQFMDRISRRRNYMRKNMPFDETVELLPVRGKYSEIMKIVEIYMPDENYGPMGELISKLDI